MKELTVLIMFFIVWGLAPLAYIWGLNTLFNLGIAYTFTNWLATIVVGVFIRGVNQNKESV